MAWTKNMFYRSTDDFPPFEREEKSEENASVDLDVSVPDSKEAEEKKQVVLKEDDYAIYLHRESRS